MSSLPFLVLISVGPADDFFWDTLCMPEAEREALRKTQEATPTRTVRKAKAAPTADTTKREPEPAAKIKKTQSDYQPFAENEE